MAGEKDLTVREADDLVEWELSRNANQYTSTRTLLNALRKNMNDYQLGCTLRRLVQADRIEQKGDMYRLAQP